MKYTIEIQDIIRISIEHNLALYINENSIAIYKADSEGNLFDVYTEEWATDTENSPENSLIKLKEYVK